MLPNHSDEGDDCGMPTNSSKVFEISDSQLVVTSHNSSDNIKAKSSHHPHCPYEVISNHEVHSNLPPRSPSKAMQEGHGEVPVDPMQKSARIGRLFRVSSQQKGFQPAPSFHPKQNCFPRDDVEEEIEDASWSDVLTACCCHSPREWLSILVGITCLLTCMYFFLLALQLLGTSFQVVGGCEAGSLLGSDTNPLAALCIGVIATAILQSSAITTAIVVSLVSGGLDVKQAIYLVMGANVGTSVTSMIVSLAHMGDGDELERAFSGASLLLVFNVCTISILFPLELIAGYLYEFSRVMLPPQVGEGDNWEGPIKKIVSPLADLIIMANQPLIIKASNNSEICDDQYPIKCDGEVSYEACEAGLIGCSSKTDKCPAFFQESAIQDDDIASGWVCLVISLFLLIVCLVALVALLKKILLGASTRIIYKATNINGYISILIGAAVTVLVQSSSITASALTPLAGIGVLKIEQMYPLIIGADIGTTITALLAAMVSSKVEGLQVALCHILFNVSGAIIWYVVPFMRRLPLFLARYLGQVTRKWRQFPILFIPIIFFVFPILLLGVSACFEKKTKGFQALGVFLTILMLGSIFYFWIWWRYKGGKSTCRACISRRKRRQAALMVLADDMDYIKVDLEYCKNEIGRLKDFAGVVMQDQERTGKDASEAGEDETFELPPEERLDGQMSIHGSIRGKKWAAVLKDAGQSIKGSLQSMKL